MDWLLQQWEWIKDHDSLVAWIGAISLVTLIVSFIAVPIVIRRMPYDYFLENSSGAEEIREQHPVLRIFFRVLKNLIGGILVIGGLIMFVTPGQGVLTLLIGLLLMDFPGKRGLEIRLMRLKPVRKTVDWIRARAEKPALVLPE
ncbi:hypothetical protein N9B21_00085 [Verrucomicrobiales bacterium]|nr:hypothetical protein [Verrucomicrobiales bacterium]|tara:strand:- start:295 stop:726 length:432 start_codon:yes stop_codon:yes gene_type:complete